MRITLISIIISTIMVVPGLAFGSLLPQVVEKRLVNGIKILLVEHPQIGAVHVHTFIRCGRSNTGTLPPIAADLLARTIFDKALPSSAVHDLTTNLEGGANVIKKMETEQTRLRQKKSNLSNSNFSAIPTNTIEKINAVKLKKILDDAKIWDALDSIGASSRSLAVTADYCSYGMDLPKNAITAWSQIESDRLSFLPIFDILIEQKKLALDSATNIYPSNNYLYTLLTTSMLGSPYAAASEYTNQLCINSITVNDIKKYASYTMSPENIILIIIGDINSNEVIHQLENTFGKLQKLPNNQTSCASPHIKIDNEINHPIESSGSRRLMIDTNGDARIFFGWRIPPINHPDRAVIMALTKILDIRCNENITASRNIVRKLTVQMGIPGQRNTNLLVIQAEPQEGHHLKGLEQAIECEIAKLQQEPISNQELHQLQAKIKLDELTVQEDAKTLAETLGECLCQGDDWRFAFSILGATRDLTPYEIQLAAQTYLSSYKMTTVLITPSLTSIPMDWTENQIIQIFKKVLEDKSGDTIKVQDMLGETLRQIRMLSTDERSRLLKLLANKAHT